MSLLVLGPDARVEMTPASLHKERLAILPVADLSSESRVHGRLTFTK